MHDNIIEKNIDLFVCPGCSGRLKYSGDRLLCFNCAAGYNIYEKCIIDFLPKEPEVKLEFENAYEGGFFKSYNEKFNEKFILSDGGGAWGAPELLSRKHLKRKINLVNQILSECKYNGKIAADISSGAGWFTLELAARYGLVLNMDLDVKNISYVYNKAKTRKINNIIFIRCDMFAPPVAHGSVDQIICTDTLIYGDYMVKKFLENMLPFLSDDGLCIADFYNRLHRNPIHKPYMTGYSKKEIFAKFLNRNKYSIGYRRFIQESAGIFKFLFPPTRHIISIRNKIFN